MIKMLQRKFIVTAMTAVSVLIVVLLGAINILNYRMEQRQTEQILNMLTEREVIFSAPIKPEPGQRYGFLEPPMNEDAVLAARYFIVFLDEMGEFERADISHISSVTEDTAEKIAGNIQAGGREAGSIDKFQYRVMQSGNGQGSIIIFLDNSNQIFAVLRVFVISVCLGLLCWLFMLLLVILLSRKAIRPIAQNIERQKQFVTDAGHEIKTPLAIILANTEAMELHIGETKWSKNIRSQVGRLNGLMQELLFLAKMEEIGEAEGKRLLTEVSVSRVLEETLSSYEEAAGLRNLTITKEIQSGITICTDAGQMQQLFSILIDNAVKYSQENGHIWVSLDKKGSKAFFQIKNTCDILPDAAPEKLFDRFYRGDGARTQKNGGYGIGLSAARAIVEAHHGTIHAEYEAGRKILFTVCFNNAF